jgi:hypothetical protein
VIQPVPSHSQDCCRILDLPLRLRELRPFELGDDYVLGTRYKEWDIMKADTLATPEFLLAEGSRLADDQVNFLARCQVDHIEHGLPLASFQGGTHVGVVFGGR